MWGFIVALLGFLSLLANAQVTQTTTDANGNTIVEVVSTDPIALIPTTIIISTVVGTTTAAATPTTATTTAADQVGPVGAPGPTGSASAGAPTPYTYTTVIGGVTYTSADVFTPTSPPTISTNIPASGTIWNYSSWAASYGPPTGKSNAAVQKATIGSGSFTWMAIGFSTFAGVLSGAWMILL